MDVQLSVTEHKTAVMLTVTNVIFFLSNRVELIRKYLSKDRYNIQTLKFWK